MTKTDKILTTIYAFSYLFLNELHYKLSIEMHWYIIALSIVFGIYFIYRFFHSLIINGKKIYICLFFVTISLIAIFIEL